MTPPVSGIESAAAQPLSALITPTEQGIASRVLLRAPGGTMTLFAFDAGQDISSHATAFEAMAQVLEGTISFTIGEASVRAAAGTVVRLPANVPHALSAAEPARMLLVMFRTDAVPAGPPPASGS